MWMKVLRLWRPGGPRRASEIAGVPSVREACAIYVRLRGTLWLLPLDHPDRPVVQKLVDAADRQWRALAADDGR